MKIAEYREVEAGTGEVKEGYPEECYSQIMAFLGYGFCKCLSPETWVETPQGKKHLKDLQIGEEVKAPDENGHDAFVKVLGVFDSEAELYEIETEDGHRLTSSLEHKYLCADGMMRPLSEVIAEEHKIIVG